MAKRDYDSTVARIAGNLLSGKLEMVDFDQASSDVQPYMRLLHGAVMMARAIVAEVQRTAPAEGGT